MYLSRVIAPQICPLYLVTFPFWNWRQHRLNNICLTSTKLATCSWLVKTPLSKCLKIQPPKCLCWSLVGYIYSPEGSPVFSPFFFCWAAESFKSTVLVPHPYHWRCPCCENNCWDLAFASCWLTVRLMFRPFDTSGRGEAAFMWRHNHSQERTGTCSAGELIDGSSFGQM